MFLFIKISGDINTTIRLTLCYTIPIQTPMEESLKNLLYQGLGVISITKDKVEKVVAELVEKGKLSREEGMKFAEELSTEAKKAGEEFKASGKDTLREWFEKSGIPSREEFEALKARVAELEKLHSAEPAQ